MGVRTLRRYGGIGEIWWGRQATGTVAAEKKLEVDAASHRRGGDPALDAMSDAWMETSASTAAPRRSGDP